MPLIAEAENLGSVLQPDTIQKLMVKSSQYSHLFFNSGLWWVVDGENRFVDHERLVFDEIQKFRNKTSSEVKIHWKMTTASKLNNRPEFNFTHSLVNSGAFHSFFDTWSLTIGIVQSYPEYLWDSVHFFGPVYKGLNQVLIAYLSSLHVP